MTMRTLRARLRRNSLKKQLNSSVSIHAMRLLSERKIYTTLRELLCPLAE
jgi:hypothetical protein